MDEKDEIIAAQAKLIEELRARIAELERRLGLHSGNSSKPPSSDAFVKRTLALREKSNKLSGGQRGHPGKTLMQRDIPDHVVEHRVVSCAVCKEGLSKIPIKHLIKRQVFDITIPKLEVTEHQAEVKICTCGHTTTATFPSHVAAPLQYGANVKATVVYLANQQMIPEDRLQQTLEDTYGVHISTQTIASIQSEAAENLAAYREQTMETIKQAAVKHVDESGLRVAGKTHWVHVYSTETETVYDVTPKRKNVVEGMKGILTHDHWKSYFKWVGVDHALCNAHHLRELRAIEVLDKEPWALKMRHLLIKMNERSYQKTGLHIPWMRRCYDMFIEEGLKYHEGLAPLSGRKRRPGHNILLRLKRFKAETLRFLDNDVVPFTNNLAERDIRMIKVKQKISGSFRTIEGAKNFLVIRGYISTMRKRQDTLFRALQNIMQAT